MSGPEPPVREDELHAYLDEQLPSTCLSAVQRHLGAHPADAARIERYAAQREALRAAFAAEESETPPRLDLSRLLEERMRRRLFWRVAAAAVLTFGIGGAVGWLWHSETPPSGVALAMSILEEQAVTAHTVYAAERRHAVEVPGSERNQLVGWLSARLGRTVNPPHLSTAGYRLIGGRLLANESGGASAMFLYEGVQGDRLTLVMRPMSPDLKSPEHDVSRGALSTCAWITHGMGYALVAAAPESGLDRLVGLVKAELGTG